VGPPRGRTHASRTPHAARTPPPPPAQRQLLASKLSFPRAAATLVYLLISFFEQPAWCYADGVCAQLRAADGAKYKASGLPALPLALTQAVELGCLALFGLDLLLKYGYRGHGAFCRSWVNLLTLALIATAAADVCFTIGFGFSLAGGRARLAAFIRPNLFVALDRRVRQVPVAGCRHALLLDDLDTLYPLIMRTAACCNERRGT
jgi:hypothetical protein